MDTGAGKYVEVAGDNMTGDLTLGTDKITLDASDGSAEFAGRISGNGECFLGDNNSDPRGYLKIVNNSTNEDDDAIRITDTTNNNVARIRVDGSATFNSTVKQGDFNGGRIDATGSVLLAAGGIATQYEQATTASTARAFRVYHGTSENATVFADGSATFTGDITANNVTFNLEPDNDANYTTTTEEYTETESYTGPLGNTLEREVTKTRDIRTYTGPTLDVKDRLQNLIARLDALEADEISDDAASNALLTLIASLTARVDARDAVIAELTTRIQTLEGGNN